MQCDACLYENVQYPAVAHCQECNESFCEQCKDVHSRIKLGRTHKLSDIHDIPCQQDRSYLQQLKACPCSGQPSRIIEYFCSDHDVFCCGKCAFSKHRKCDEVNEVADVIRADTDETVEAPLEALEQKVHELTELAREKTKLAKESYSVVEQRLEVVKGEIDSAYYDLKTNVLKDAETHKEALENEIMQQTLNIEALSMQLNEKKANANTVRRYGNDIDKHVFSHVLEQSALTEMNSSESRIRNSLSLPGLFSTKEKHRIEEIVQKLKEAIEVVNKETITGSDSSYKELPTAKYHEKVAFMDDIKGIYDSQTSDDSDEAYVGPDYYTRPPSSSDEFGGEREICKIKTKTKQSKQIKKDLRRQKRRNERNVHMIEMKQYCHHAATGFNG